MVRERLVVAFNLSSFDYNVASNSNCVDYYKDGIVVACSWDNASNKEQVDYDGVDYYFENGHKYSCSNFMEFFHDSGMKVLKFDGRLHLWREEEI